jgi:hypothetical protein
MSVETPSSTPLKGVKNYSPGEVRATEPHLPLETPKTKLSKEIALLQAFVSGSRAFKEELNA